MHVKIYKSAGFLLALVAWLFSGLYSASDAAPPVRIAVVPSGGSGQEQSVVDGVQGRLEGDPNIVLSTVNPDWYVVCNIQEAVNQPGGSVKVNGTLTVKTTDGQVIDTIAVQTNKQDFSLQPGAPLNKALVDRAAREVIAGLTERATEPIVKAVRIEIATRDRIIQAQMAAYQDKYGEAIGLLLPVSPDTVHFLTVRKLIQEYKMEKQALELITSARELAKQKNYTNAISALDEVSPKSKRFAESVKLARQYKAARAELARLRKVKTNRASAKARKPQPSKGPSTQDQQKALDAQKKALEAQLKAIKAQEAALNSKKSK